MKLEPQKKIHRENRFFHSVNEVRILLSMYELQEEEKVGQQHFFLNVYFYLMINN